MGNTTRISNNPKLKANAQKLRREMTPEERHLWYDFLSTLTIRFRRQKTVGWYIADFYCPAARLVVEVDGGQHYEPEQESYDYERDRYMQSLGLTVLRYSNLDIKNNFEGVCTDILNHIEVKR